MGEAGTVMAEVTLGDGVGVACLAGAAELVTAAGAEDGTTGLVDAVEQAVPARAMAAMSNARAAPLANAR